MISIDGLLRASTCDKAGSKIIAQEFADKAVTAIIGGYCSDDSFGLLQITQALPDPIPAVSYAYDPISTCFFSSHDFISPTPSPPLSAVIILDNTQLDKCPIG